MIAVIDANIALALVLDFAYSDKARRAVNSMQTMIAPDLVIHESTNALWKIAMSSPEHRETCQTLLGIIPSIFDEIVPANNIAASALDLAIKLNHPAYDCFYLALTASRDAHLITADRKLAAAAERADDPLRVTLIEP